MLIALQRSTQSTVYLNVASSLIKTLPFFKLHICFKMCMCKEKEREREREREKMQEINIHYLYMTINENVLLSLYYDHI